MRTSSTPKSATGQGAAIWRRKAARSTSVPSALLLRKSADRLRSNQATSDIRTERMKPWLSSCRTSRSLCMSEPVEVRANAEPAAGAPRIDIGVASRPRLPVGLRIPESGMDQREGIEQPDAHVDGFEVRAGIGSGDAGEECLAVDDRGVGIACQEILGQVLLVPADIRGLRRTHVAAVELVQYFKVGHGW